LEVSGQLHALAPLPLGKNSGSHWIEGWVVIIIIIIIITTTIVKGCVMEYSMNTER
jgi:hypothetical protein